MSSIGSDGHPGPYNGYKKAPIPYIKHRRVKLGLIPGTKILHGPFIGYDDLTMGLGKHTMPYIMH